MTQKNEENKEETTIKNDSFSHAASPRLY